MTINSCAKGKRFERAVAKTLAALFPHVAKNARRGRQYSGSPDSPDVVAMPGVHVEAKHVERLNIWDALAQAERDAGDQIPIVIFKRNRSKMFMAMRLEDAPAFVDLILPDSPDSTDGDTPSTGDGS